MEFKSFQEIKQYGKLFFAITQKIHGSNAQVFIFQTEDGSLDLLCGSRSRWICPHSDNYGFAAFVHAHKQEFIEKLGVGRHFGEWAGPGINSGEGLKEKMFLLFDWWRYQDKPLPPQTAVVPVLYSGVPDLSKIDEAMEDLKKNGSKLAPGFMNPEGIVINLNGLLSKKVFKPEETQWTKSPGNKGKNPKQKMDFAYLLQPIRLEKLLSRDERYVREYPQSLPSIVKDYLDDLEKEQQIPGMEDEIKAIRKAASSQVFSFIRSVMDEMPDEMSLKTGG